MPWRDTSGYHGDGGISAVDLGARACLEGCTMPDGDHPYEEGEGSGCARVQLLRFNPTTGHWQREWAVLMGGSGGGRGAAKVWGERRRGVRALSDPPPCRSHPDPRVHNRWAVHADRERLRRCVVRTGTGGGRGPPFPTSGDRRLSRRCHATHSGRDHDGRPTARYRRHLAAGGYIKVPPTSTEWM